MIRIVYVNGSAFEMRLNLANHFAWILRLNDQAERDWRGIVAVEVRDA